jgi:hypothetical protein
MKVASHPAYDPQFSSMMAHVARMASGVSRGPERVAEVILRAASDTSGKLRYPVDGRIILALHTMLPDVLWRSLAGRLTPKPSNPTTPSAATAL